MVHSLAMKRDYKETADPKHINWSDVRKNPISADATWWSLLRELYNRFTADQCSAWAAALSFYALLSLVPILIFGVAAVGLIYHDSAQATEAVQRFVTSLLPGANASAQAAKIIADAKVPEQAKSLMEFSGIASVIGLVTFFWTASRIFVNAIPPMNAAFGVQETRGFLKLQLYALGLLLGTGVLFFLSLLTSAGTAALHPIPWFARLPNPSPWWLQLIFIVLGIAVNVVMFTVIYRFLPSPSAEVNFREAAVGGTVVAILWEAAKQGFALYLRNFGGENGYNKIYGSLGGLMILVLWINYTSILLLLGAEITRLWGDHQAMREEANHRVTANNAGVDLSKENREKVTNTGLKTVRNRGK